MLHGAELDAGVAAGTALSQLGSAASDSDEEPHRWVAHGDGDGVKQTAPARKNIFSELLESVPAMPTSVLQLLQLSRGQVELFEGIQQRLMKELRSNAKLRECGAVAEHSGVDQVALSWVLEIGEVQRFRSVAQAVSYCGLGSAQRGSAGKEQWGPISKQRNKYLQTILIEAAKLAARYNSQLAAVQERKLGRGNRNRATLAVVRKPAHQYRPSARNSPCTKASALQCAYPEALTSFSGIFVKHVFRDVTGVHTLKVRRRRNVLTLFQGEIDPL
jgi:hypothetical protein